MLPNILIRPQNPKTKTIAQITVSEGIEKKILISFPEKREDFRKILKSFGYSWDEYNWYKRVESFEEGYNFSAEIARKLLFEGFYVSPPNQKVQEMIVTENFEGEKRKKIGIQGGEHYKGWFLVWWERGEDCYKQAMRITGARYCKPCVVAPPEQYEEVEDFANRYEFFITPIARREIEKIKAMYGSAMLLEIEEEKKEVFHQEEDYEILDELADKD